MTVLFLCLQIFFFRIIDVSLGVIRTIFSVKRKPLFASAIGFVEILIWFFIVSNALNASTESIYVALAYAGGFAAGTLIGGLLSRHIVRTKINVQVISSSRDKTLIRQIRAAGFPATVIEALGSGEENSQRYMLFIEINSVDFKSLKQLVLSIDSKAFIFVNEVTTSVGGFYYGNK